jgi:hypothetical protein
VKKSEIAAKDFEVMDETVHSPAELEAGARAVVG